jgi:glycosyltransferase XagB
MARQRRRERSAGHRDPEPNPRSIIARMRHAGQRASPRHRLLPSEHPYAFLVGTRIDLATLERAEAEARRCAVDPHDILLAGGWISEADYAVALADRLGIPPIPQDAVIELAAMAPLQGTGPAALSAYVDGRPCHVLVATGGTPDALMHQVVGLRASGRRVTLAPHSLIEAALESHGQRERVDRAVRGLLRSQPTSSARLQASPWQPTALALLIGTTIGGLVVLPEAALVTITTAVALPFLCVTLLRLVALREAMTGRSRPRKDDPGPERLPDAQLPLYSVLVPLFRETKVLPGLIQALRELDYPPSKLEIMLVVEAIDLEIQAALATLDLPRNFRTLVVPNQEPRTKPKALNYALQLAQGSFVVVYDAEDRPESDQLRLALDLFRRADPKLGCLQAQLNIYNHSQSWLTRGLMAQTPLAWR